MIVFWGNEQDDPRTSRSIYSHEQDAQDQHEDNSVSLAPCYL